MAINLAEQLKLLVELQGLDTQIYKIQEEIDLIPQKIKEMDDLFGEKSVNLKALEDAVKALQLKRKDKEGELKTKEDSIKKFQTQMYQVKTNKEYTTFQDEIARAKADCSVIEEDILKIFDQVDSENKKIAQEKEFLKKEEVVLAEEKKRFSDESGRLAAEIEKLKAQRAQLSSKVDKDVLTKYERILNNRDHLAVVPVVIDSCQGCFAKLPPQVLNEIRMKDAIVICESCARMLYIDE